MITIGLTGWSDHPVITSDPKRKLENYSSHFPFVEIDTSFYGIPAEVNIDEWIEKTPDTFQFIPKAYAPMTRHRPWKDEDTNITELFDLFKTRFYPMHDNKRLKACLFQFPPFFRYSNNNIEYLNFVREWMGSLPVAIEFRHPSWFNENNKENTLKILANNYFIHTVVDQPQTPGNSTQKIIEVTNKNLVLYRLHGRNYSGWLKANEDPDWRRNRTFYEYTTKELDEIKNNVHLLKRDAKEVAVIFNNNSGFHAAKNAKELQKMLDLKFDNLNPQQLNLF